MSEVGGLHRFLGLVRRRHARNVVLEQIAHALSVAMGGVILLLILGTQILNWYWLVLVFGGSLAVGVVRAMRRMPSLYELAQVVDRRLKLHDALSTALFFSRENARRASEPVRHAQRAAAEQLAQEADIRLAVPMVLPRGLYAAGVLAAVALTMLGVRYGVRRSLDLRPPLASILVDLFRPIPLVAEQKKTAAQKRLEEQWQQMGIALDQPEAEKNGATDQAPDSASTVDTPDLDPTATQNQQSSKSKDAASDQTAGEPENAEKSDSAPDASGNAGNDDRSRSNQPNSPNGKRPPSQPGENSSLMDKMRDAMANLLAKLKIQPKGAEGRESTSQQGGSQSGQQQMGQSGQKGGQPQQQASSDSQGQQEGEGNEQSQTAQGKGGERGSDRQAPQDAKSGIGKNDGSKDLKDAEQLAAMGKISEIIGKRAANITGEVMVEVASGKQQLRTPYSQKRAAHAEAGGEIHRDEVPLELQHFVQQYFEEIHKAPPAAAAAPAKPAVKKQP